MDAMEGMGSRLQVPSLSRTVTPVRKINKFMHNVIITMLIVQRRVFIKKTLRIVVDLRDCYYLATEELGCKECGRNFQCWDQR